MTICAFHIEMQHIKHEWIIDKLLTKFDRVLIHPIWIFKKDDYNENKS